MGGGAAVAVPARLVNDKIGDAQVQQHLCCARRLEQGTNRQIKVLEECFEWGTPAQSAIDQVLANLANEFSGMMSLSLDPPDVLLVFLVEGSGPCSTVSALSSSHTPFSEHGFKDLRIDVAVLGQRAPVPDQKIIVGFPN